ncbi:MAG: radical SAM protein, partial [Candidatus Eisenbacteria sp.]|nr:radical SAM protein [Candidatus Eisenbacteria bacterium]
MPSSFKKLIGLTTPQLAQIEEVENEPPFRIKQIASWIYAKGVRHFTEMTSLPNQLRERLARTCSLDRLPVVLTQVSSDGSTRKFLFGLSDGLQVEAVLIRTDARDTICVSTQVGCSYGCRFCATAAMGLKRNLTPHEILSQVLIVRDEIQAAGGSGHFNLVFMGMGEPLANYGSLVPALEVLNEDHGLAVGRRRMTVSTVGLLPQIRRLASEPVTVRLAL